MSGRTAREPVNTTDRSIVVVNGDEIGSSSHIHTRTSTVTTCHTPLLPTSTPLLYHYRHPLHPYLYPLRQSEFRSGLSGNLWKCGIYSTARQECRCVCSEWWVTIIIVRHIKSVAVSATQERLSIHSAARQECRCVGGMVCSCLGVYCEAKRHIKSVVR